MSYSKNEIVELQRDITVGESNYPKGTLFVVEDFFAKDATGARIVLKTLDSSGKKKLNDGIESKATTILKITKSTDKKLEENIVKLKKGQIFTFNEDETFDFDQQVTVLKGTRVIVLKGGSKPEIAIDQPLGHATMFAITYPLADFSHMFTEAKPVDDEILRDWSVKKLRTLEGRRGYHVTANLCYKDQPVIEYEVEHIGCDPELIIKKGISEEAKKSLDDVLNKIMELESKYDGCKRDRDYALETLGNFLTSQSYQLRTIERDIKLSAQT